MFKADIKHVFVLKVLFVTASIFYEKCRTVYTMICVGVAVVAQFIASQVSATPITFLAMLTI